MYFKQLEIVGFKSFPNKTKLKFEPGITAVVGPNGCGKSNISDAIKWVLGEQSPKSLRGSSMEDVIFSGTDSVDPINMAEVSLTLSNEDRALPIDYDEVTITRRLFRSGESEYILNKTPVRLKDINSLLMGTGMGTSSYSIIEQGRIGLILSSKPEDRRYIFEEASGITRYKTKKKEALRKLEHTENNLVRINDIITEVKRQINSIERHAKKAERYRTDFEAMKELDVKLAVFELRNLKSDLEESARLLDSLSQEEHGLKSNLEESIVLIDRYRKELEDAMSNLSQLQEKLAEVTLFVDKSKHRIEINGERINDLKTLRINGEKETAILKDKLRAQEEEIASIKARFNEMLTAKEEKEKELLQNEAEAQKLSSEIDKHQKDERKSKNRTVDLLAIQTKTKNELIKLGADLQNRKLRLQRLTTEKENITEEKNKINTQFDLAERALSTCTAKVEEKRRECNELKSHIESLQHKLKDLKGRIANNKARITSLDSKEELLKEMIENFEGFDKGVKILMEGVKSGALSGVKGVIADMIEPKNGYEFALEIILDKMAQAVVVEDRESLARAVSYLAKRGSAHFIINQEVAGAASRSRTEEIAQKYKLTPLSTYAKVDESRKHISDYLFEGVYIAENTENAEEILHNTGDEIKVVTKDGSFFEKGHVFTGLDKNRSSTSIIGRSKKLEEIAREKLGLLKSVENLETEEKGKEEELNKLKEEVALSEATLKKEEIEEANALSKRGSIGTSLKKVEDEMSILELEIDEVGEIINDISAKGERLNVQLNENESEYANEESVIFSSQEAVQTKTKLKNELALKISEINSNLTFLKSTEESEARKLDKEFKALEELKEQYNGKETAISECETKIESLENETKTLEENIESRQIEEKELREKLNQISKERQMLSEELHNKESASRKKEAKLEDLRNQIRSLEIKSREGELKTSNVKDRMRDVYKMDIQAVDLEIEEGTNWEEVRNQIEVFKIKLEKLGPVNLVAIDEHKELEERHSFLTQQQEDLLQAKESLHKAIAKINKTTKQLFIESFQKIQVEFKNYFRMLFAGGHAELLLLDEGDVLESGIEIVARPPGKKLQNLLLLSGGEKAMTAIALLFAIFKVKPSPFCILDEVDAPLDESNIGRFTRILQDFLKTSQFIVITHSKKTMQMANVLYGITMETKGVSKIVSVKFEEEGDVKPSEEEEVLV